MGRRPGRQGQTDPQRLDALVQEIAAESWSQSLHSIEHGLVALERVAATLVPYGLQPGFVERGRVLAQRLLSERSEQVAAATEHVHYASQLDQEFARIEQAMELLSAARDLVMSITGDELSDLGAVVPPERYSLRPPPPAGTNGL